MLLHILILYVHPLSVLFSVTPLSWAEWTVVLYLSFPVIIIDEVLKFFSRNSCGMRFKLRLRRAELLPKREIRDKWRYKSVTSNPSYLYTLLPMEAILGNISYTICGSSRILFIVESPFQLLSASESYCERRDSASFETSCLAVIWRGAMLYYLERKQADRKM